MIVEILKPFGKWQPGAKPDLTRQYARELVDQGVARYAEYKPEAHIEMIQAEKKAEKDKAGQMVVNNYFMAPPDSEEE
jgi:hypothetical protein